RFGAAVKIVEVPPGPPVLAPVVAEVYGPTQAAREKLAGELADDMRRIDGLVDIDTTITAPTRRWQVIVDRHRAATLGVGQAQVVDTLALALGERNAGYLREPGAKYAVPIRVMLDEGVRAQPAALMSLPVTTRDGEIVRIADVARIEPSDWPGVIQHKDLLPVVYVTADMAGRIDSPLYGMFAMAARLFRGDDAPTHYWINAPDWPGSPALRWEGEWQTAS